MCQSALFVSHITAHQRPWAYQSLLSGLSADAGRAAPEKDGPSKPRSPVAASAGASASPISTMVSTAMTAVARRTAAPPDALTSLDKVAPQRRSSANDPVTTGSEA